MIVQKSLTCNEFKKMASAYALDALEPSERIACTRHLAQDGSHGGCPHAVHDARRVAARLSAALPARTPSAGLWAAIEARVTGIGAPKAAASTRWARDAHGFMSHPVARRRPRLGAH